MKKQIVLSALLLCCSLGSALWAESTGNNAEFSAVARFDANPVLRLNQEGESGFTFGNSSVYTLLDGNLGSHFSYSICNHWLAEEPADLYQNTFHSDANSWTDWANITCSFGDFELTLGKDVMLIGGFEIDEYDFNCHFDLQSYFWNYFPVYQWGGKLAYYFNEETSVAFQLSSSPFSEKPFCKWPVENVFSSGYGRLSSYSLYYRSEDEKYPSICSINMIEYLPQHFLNILSVGQQFAFGDCTLGVDLMYRSSRLRENGLRDFDEFSGVLSFAYAPSDKFDLLVKGGYEKEGGAAISILEDGDYFFGGAAAHYYPLNDSQDLRLHAVAGYNNQLGNSVSLTFGATYFFNFSF